MTKNQPFVEKSTNRDIVKKFLSSSYNGYYQSFHLVVQPLFVNAYLSAADLVSFFNSKILERLILKHDLEVSLSLTSLQSEVLVFVGLLAVPQKVIGLLLDRSKQNIHQILKSAIIKISAKELEFFTFLSSHEEFLKLLDDFQLFLTSFRSKQLEVTGDD